MKIQNVILLVILLCNLCFTYEDRNRFPIHTFNLDISTLDSLYMRQSKFKSIPSDDVRNLKEFCFDKYNIKMKGFSRSKASSFKNINQKGFVINCYDSSKMYDLLFIYNLDSTFSYLTYTGTLQKDNQIKELGFTFIEPKDSNTCFMVKTFRVFESDLDSVKGMPFLYQLRKELDTSFVVCLKRN